MKKFTTLYVAFLLYISCFGNATAQNTNSPSIENMEDGFPTFMQSDIPKDAPQFNDFKTKIYKGRLKRPNINLHPRSKQYRSQILKSATDGINFAGRFNVSSWHCGMDCREFAFTDLKTGVVYHPSNLQSVSAWMVAGYTGKNSDIDQKYIDTNLAVGYKPDSTLFIVAGPVNQSLEQPFGISYFLWQNNKMRLIRFVPVRRGHS